jgi:hypothetical protein
MEAVSPTLRCMGNRGVEQTWGLIEGQRSKSIESHWAVAGQMTA